MTNVYNTGTVSVPSNSNIVTGIDTYFQSVGNISEGDLFTLDGKEFYEIYQIDTDSQLRIKHRLSGDTYAGDAVSDVSYSIIQSFATDSIAEIAKNVVLLQQNWHRREDEMTGWFNTNNNYYQITNQQGERVLVVTPTGLTKLVDGTIDIGDGSALAELAWANIQNIPETASRWAKYSEITDKPDYAQGWPGFENVTGKVTQEQLPDSIETDSKRTQALSPPVKTELSLIHRLVDYPTMKPTESIPTHSPNNKTEILFDPVRQSVYFSFEDHYKAMPTTIEHRKFAVFFRGLFLRLNSAFTGDVTLKVFPMGSGGLGLPNNPTLSNNQWHTITENVTDLYKIGSFGGEYFEGIIDFVKVGDGWETLNTDKSHFRSLDAYFDGDGITLRSPFEDFYLRDDGYWYSENMLPETPYSIGPSWVQDNDDYRAYTVSAASDSNDGLRFFSDTYDEFEFELIVISDVNRKVALTASNSVPNIINYPGVQRFITNERLFIKRNNSTTPITGTLTFESLKMRLPNNG